MKWMRYLHQGQEGFGTLHDGHVQPHTGDLFGHHQATGAPLPVADIHWLPPAGPARSSGCGTTSAPPRPRTAGPNRPSRWYS
jgi:hypothetical protein